MVNQRGVGLLLLGLFSNDQAVGAPPSRVQLRGGESLAVPIDASASAPVLLLVQQHGIDVLIDCEGKISGAPTGRQGFEAAVLRQAATCSVRPKMAKAKPGEVSIRSVPLSADLLGTDAGHWQLFAGTLMLDDQVFQARQAAIWGYRQLLQRPPADAQLHLSWEYGLANLARQNRDSSLAQQHYSNARALATRFPEWLPAIENASGLSRLDERAFDPAAAAFARALTRAEADDNGYEAASALNNSCLVMQYQGQIAAAAACYRRAVERYEAVGESEHLAVALVNLAGAAQQLAAPDEALVVLQRALAIRRDGPYDRSLGNVLLLLAQVNSRIAQWDQALYFSQEALQVFEKLGEPGNLARAQRARASLFRSLGEERRARYYASAAVHAALRQPDQQLRAASLAEQANLEPDPIAARALRQQAAAAFRASKQEDLARREEVLAAEQLIGLGRWVDAAAELKNHAAAANDERISIQALYALSHARVALAGADWDTAIAQARLARSRFLLLRDFEGLIDSGELEVPALLKAGRLAEARLALSAVLDAHVQTTRELPSPALVATSLNRGQRLREWVVEVFQADRDAFGDEALWDALAQLDVLPSWQANRHVDPAWREYRFRLARLHEDNWKSTAERAAMIAELERLESRLELQYGHRRSEVQRLAQIRTQLPADAAALRLAVGRSAAFALILEGGGVRLFEAAGSSQDPAAASTLLAAVDAQLQSSVQRLYLLSPDKLAGPTILGAGSARRQPIQLVGAPGAADLSAIRLPQQLSVATLELPAAAPLPGAQRERRWLAAHFGARLQVIDFVRGANGKLQVPAVDVLHVAAHGWSFAGHPLAQALSGEAQHSASAQSESISLADLAFERPPKLIVLTACEAADSEAGGTALAQQLALATGATVIGPTAPVDDGSAFAFSRELFSALGQTDLNSAFAQAETAWRDAELLGIQAESTSPASTVWQIVVAGQMTSTTVGDLAALHHP